MLFRSDVKIVRPHRHGDARGFFAETYNRRRFTEHGIAAEFVQDNHSHSVRAGTVRGLHFQLPPLAQAKLVSVVVGAAFDVAVDLRTGSPTHGRHVAVMLTAESGEWLYIPAGFAHGYCTLEPDTDLVYKVTNYYSAAHDRGVAWDDPALAIPWPVKPGEATLSDKDKALPRLAGVGAIFAYP